jgi:hypothetical protein
MSLTSIALFGGQLLALPSFFIPPSHSVDVSCPAPAWRPVAASLGGCPHNHSNPPRALVTKLTRFPQSEGVPERRLVVVWGGAGAGPGQFSMRNQAGTLQRTTMVTRTAARAQTRNTAPRQRRRTASGAAKAPGVQQRKEQPTNTGHSEPGNAGRLSAPPNHRRTGQPAGAQLAPRRRRRERNGVPAAAAGAAARGGRAAARAPRPRARGGPLPAATAPAAGPSRTCRAASRAAWRAAQTRQTRPTPRTARRRGPPGPRARAARRR